MHYTDFELWIMSVLLHMPEVAGGLIVLGVALVIAIHFKHRFDQKKTKTSEEDTHDHQ